MGLITQPTYVQAAVSIQPVNVQATVAPQPTYVQHVPIKVCTEGSSSSPYEETLSFDKTIYRVFSKQDDMKTLVYPERVKSEFDLYLQYAEAKTLGAVDSNFDTLDEYLGSLGVTEEYCEVV